MPRIVDHLCNVLALHENNAIVLYSPTLSKQIPRSFAASAFNIFQHGLHQFEIVKICALWDGAGLEKENIPTIVELVDHTAIVEALAVETAAQWRQKPSPRSLNPSDDPELRALELEAIQRHHTNFGERQADRVRSELPAAIAEGRAIMSSSRLHGIMNLRDKHLAHNLAHTRREKGGPVSPMKYGHEREILEATLPIVEALYRCINGTSFSFEDSRKIERKNAKALWDACVFQVKS
jgi:hypothetical protein